MKQKDSSITMRTVAQRAGVSYQTVSRVINDAAGVAPGTRARVLAAMRELGYRPSLAARSLARNRTEIVGLVLPGPVDAGFAGAHLLQVVGGVDRGVSDNDYTTLLSGPKESEPGLSAFRRLIRQRTVDGVLVEASMGEEGVELLVEAGYPVTVIGHTALDVPSVRPDDESGAYVAVQHLLALGHRRIAVVTGGERTLAVRARRAGCERALADAGVALDRRLVVTGDWSPASGRSAAERLLQHAEPPTAYFCFNDGMAIGVLQLLRERGIDVPRQVSVAGFDDTPPAPLLSPPLTSVRVFSAEQGERAARTLIGILRGMTPPGAPVVLPSQLVVRGSTAPVGPR